MPEQPNTDQGGPRPPREQEQDKSEDPNAGTLGAPREEQEGGDEVGDVVPDA